MTPYGGVVAHVILVSAHGPNPSFFLFWGVCWDRGFDLELGQGLTILLFSFFGGLLFNLGVCWDRGLDSDLDQGLTINTPVL